MKTNGAYTAFKAVACLVAVSVLCPSYASAQADSLDDVLKGLKAPASPERPWQPPDMTGFAGVIKTRAEPEADPQRDYDLAGLLTLPKAPTPKRKLPGNRPSRRRRQSGSLRVNIFRSSR